MKKCVIGLPIYNNAHSIKYVVKNISEIKHIFAEIHVIACYDVCRDDSLAVLAECTSEYQIPLTTIKNDTLPDNSQRTTRIAAARNNILREMRKVYKDYDYLIMMDTNHYACTGKINKDVLVKAIDREDEWDGLSFTREDGYYDHWALSYDPYVYSFVHFTRSDIAVKKLREDYMNYFHRFIENDAEALIPVYSAFNGFAIYKTKSIQNCSYSSSIAVELFPFTALTKQISLVGNQLIPVFEGDCEHRRFHLEAIQKNLAKICIYYVPLFGKTPSELDHIGDSHHRNR